MVRYYKQFYLTKGVETKLEEIGLRKPFEFWQVVLHSDTINEATKAKVIKPWCSTTKLSG
jgi:hypothetical protein